MTSLARNNYLNVENQLGNFKKCQLFSGYTLETSLAAPLKYWRGFLKPTPSTKAPKL